MKISHFFIGWLMFQFAMYGAWSIGSYNEVFEQEFNCDEEHEHIPVFIGSIFPVFYYMQDTADLVWSQVEDYCNNQ